MVVGGGLLLTACGSDDGAASTPTPAPASGSTGSAAGEARVVTHEFGETSVPADPSAVVAIDEYAALDLLSVGITPSVVFTTWGSEIGQDILREAGATIVPVAMGDGVSAETVLAQHPDLVVFTSIGDPTFYDSIAGEVPTLPIPSTTTPWRDKLVVLGDAFGEQDRAADLTAALEARLDALHDAAAWPSSVSALMYNSGILAVPTGSAPSSQLFGELGITMPSLQRAPSESGSPYAPLSPELLGEQDADLVLVFAEGVYDAAAVEATPGFSALGAVARGDVAEVNGDMWFGTHALAISWMLDDLEALTAHRLDGVGTAADAVARSERFEALVDGPG